VVRGPKHGARAGKPDQPTANTLSAGTLELGARLPLFPDGEGRDPFEGQQPIIIAEERKQGGVAVFDRRPAGIYAGRAAAHYLISLRGKGRLESGGQIETEVADPVWKPTSA